jgi:hypothetical protein
MDCQFSAASRGTNKTEAMHRVLGMDFGHLFSGPRYSNNLLAEVRHRYNWHMSEKYREDFASES